MEIATRYSLKVGAGCHAGELAVHAIISSSDEGAAHFQPLIAHQSHILDKVPLVGQLCKAVERLIKPNFPVSRLGRKTTGYPVDTGSHLFDFSIVARRLIVHYSAVHRQFLTGVTTTTLVGRVDNAPPRVPAPGIENELLSNVA